MTCPEECFCWRCGPGFDRCDSCGHTLTIPDAECPEEYRAGFCRQVDEDPYQSEGLDWGFEASRMLALK